MPITICKTLASFFVASLVIYIGVDGWSSRMSADAPEHLPSQVRKVKTDFRIFPDVLLLFLAIHSRNRSASEHFYDFIEPTPCPRASSALRRLRRRCPRACHTLTIWYFGLYREASVFQQDYPKQAI